MKKIIFYTALIYSFSTSAAPNLMADTLVITNPSQTTTLGEKDVRDLYLGTLKMRQLDLLDQADGQTARADFIDKLLHKSESELKRQRSILVFSGNRIPTVLSDDAAIIERVKSNPKAIGYVTSDSVKKLNINPQDIKIIFTLK